MSNTNNNPYTLTSAADPMGTLVYGQLNIYSAPLNIGMVKDWLAEVERYNLPEDTPLADGVLLLEVPYAVEPIECADHFDDDKKYDIILLTHDHEEKQ